MKIRCITTVILLLITLQSVAGDSLPTIAVYQPKLERLPSTTQTEVEKMMRIELSKLQRYRLYDEFDMKEVLESDSTFSEVCLSKTCLVKLGNALDVDFILSGSYERVKNRIVIFLKLIDVRRGELKKSSITEFDDQEGELQRMTEIAIKEIHGIDVSKEPMELLKLDKDPVVKNNVGTYNNSGPRVGYALMTGNLREFAVRSEREGGLGIFPGGMMIGYQVEKQYIGSENFSALVEGVLNVTGLDQGIFIPSFTLMNGFRFGKGGWEIAFGPGFGFKRASYGFFDTEGIFGDAGTYYSEKDWINYAQANYEDDPVFNQDGYFETPDPSYFHRAYNLNDKHLDARGNIYLNTTFVFALGRTFHAGSLNIPVNAFYSARKNSALVGVSVGFNVLKSKKKYSYR